jgi:hypothetical protein
MILFVWSLTTGMLPAIPIWITHTIWFGTSVWLLFDSFNLLNDLDDATRQLQKTHTELDIHTAAKIDTLERHLKAYILCADMRRTLQQPPKHRPSRSHST